MTESVRLTGLRRKILMRLVDAGAGWASTSWCAVGIGAVAAVYRNLRRMAELGLVERAQNRVSGYWPMWRITAAGRSGRGVGMTVPVPLVPLGRLNRHARSTAAYGVRGAIYAYKLLAALCLALEGAARLRFVRLTTPCNRCDKGWFRHWDWDDGYRVPCRDCGGSGRQTLRFTETLMPDGQVWHHPWEGRSDPGRVLASQVLGARWCDDGLYRTCAGQVIEWRDPGDWRPNLPAQSLPLFTLVDDLNAVEEWIEAATEPCDGWIAKDARRYLRRRAHRGVIGEPSHGYQLDLGRVPGGCFVCGGERYIGYGRSTRLLHWSLPVCRRHAEGPERVPFPDDPPPEMLLTPAVRRWLERHERVQAVP